MLRVARDDRVQITGPVEPAVPHVAGGLAGGTSGSAKVGLTGRSVAIRKGRGGEGEEMIRHGREGGES